MFDMHEYQLREASQELTRRLRDGEQRVVELILQQQAVLAANSDQVIELIFAEFVTREELGQQPDPAEYYDRFPHLRARVERLLKIYEVFDQETAGESSTAFLQDTQVTIEDVEGLSRGMRSHIGDYEILEEIGRGGMGVVYKARHRTMLRKVALKEIQVACDSVEQRIRLLREARLAASLRHPNIVQIYEVGQAASGPYFAMEWVAGGSLDQRIGEEHWNANDAARIVKSIADGMEFAHRCGIVHRDLKPANILIEEGGEPRISDFGLAKMFDIKLETGDPRIEPNMTQTGAILGTPCYMAPEQVNSNGAKVGVTTDVYALGVILYELLTGRPPFRGDSLVDTFQLICTAEPVPPGRLHSRLPRDLSTICLKCLNKESNRRYASAAELVDDLDAFLCQRPIRARATGVAERTAKWARRRPAIAALLVLVMVLTFSGLAGITSQWRRALRGEQAHAAARRLAEFNLYASQVALAHQALRENNTTGAREILTQCDTSFRGWEWDYLSQLCQSELHTLTGHSNVVRRVRYSPDGELLASASGDFFQRGEVILWHTVTGKRIGEVNDLSGPVFGLAFSPDGTQFAVGCLQFESRDPRPTVSIWDSRSLELVKTLPRLDATFSVAFGPAGETLFTGDDHGTIESWSITTGERQQSFRGHTQFISCFSMGARGIRLASSSRDGSVCVWDTVSGEILHRLNHGTDTRSVSLSPDGTRVVATGYGGSLTTWDLTEDPPHRTQVGVAEADTAIFGSHFSRDGARLALACEDGSVRVMNAATGHREFYFQSHFGRAGDVTFHPNGEQIACGLGANVGVWKLRRDQRFRVIEDLDHFRTTDILCHPDCTSAIVAVRSREGTPDRNDDQFLAVRRDFDTGKDFVTFRGHTGEITRMSLSAAGRLLVTASQDKTARVWLTDDGSLLHTLQHPAAVTAVADLGASGFILTGDAEGNLRKWNLSTGAMVDTVQVHRSSTQDIAARAAGDFAASLSVSGDLCWVDLKRCTFQPISKSIGTDPSCAALSPDGRYLATCQNSTITVWLVANDPSVLPASAVELTGHDAAVTGIAFSPDSRRLASAGHDHAVRLWDVSTGAETLVLKGVIYDLQMVPRVAFSPDAKRLASLWSRRVKIWSTEVTAASQLKIDTLLARSQRHALAARGAERKCVDQMLQRKTEADERRLNLLWNSAAFYCRHAVSDLEEAVRLAPGNSTHRDQLLVARFNLAKAEHHAGNQAATREQAERVQAVSRSESLSTSSKVLAAWTLANYPVKQPLDPKLAVQLGTEAVAAAPSTWHRLMLAVAQYRAGLWNQALVTLRNPNNRFGTGANLTYYFLFSALAEWRLGNASVAEQFYSQAEAMIALMSRPRVHLLMIFREATREIYGDRALIDRRLSQAASELAIRYLSESDPQAAIQAARQAAERAPRNADNLSTLGIALYRAGRHEDAARSLEDAIQANWGRPTRRILLYLCMSHYRMDNHREALQQFRLAKSWAEWQHQRGPTNPMETAEYAKVWAEAEQMIGALFQQSQDHNEPTNGDKMFRFSDTDLVPVAKATHGKIARTDRRAFGPSWDAGSELGWRPNRSGERLTITLEVPEAGIYSVTGSFTRAFDFGRFQLTVNGAPVGKPWDGFNSGPPGRSVLHTGPILVGQARLRKGKNTFAFEIVGKDPVSVGYALGIDALELASVPTP